jgi:hypothetical protein
MTATVTPTGLEPPTVVLEVIPGKCRQCGHPDGTKHDLYGTHCRWTGPGRLECMCQGLLTERCQ